MARRSPNNPGAWPRFMRAATAAAYVDDVSVECFLRKVGAVYPGPCIGHGRGAKWDREEIDQVMAVRRGCRRSSSTPRMYFAGRQREGRELARYCSSVACAAAERRSHWVPHLRDRKAGFKLPNERLGANFAAAAERASLLNELLDAWREGRGGPGDVALADRVGTVDWWHHQYFNHDASKSSARERKATIGARSRPSQTSRRSSATRAREQLREPASLWPPRFRRSPSTSYIPNFATAAVSIVRPIIQWTFAGVLGMSFGELIRDVPRSRSWT